MRVLVVGKGAREHALAWKLRRSALCDELFLWPGNAAMARLGTALPVAADASLGAVVEAALAARMDLVVVGPEAPLAEGLADLCIQRQLPVFGPVRKAAMLEASKAFAKDVMQAARVPTAAYVTACDRAACAREARAMLARTGATVIKASGLAAGKGVFVCTNEQQVDDALARLYGDMSAAAATVVVEERLVGRECSYFSFVGADGPSRLGFAVDYKRLGDGDLGPNTGGMGCYAPVPWLPAHAGDEVDRLVVRPVLAELERRGIDYRGCLYVGLMWTAQGPSVIEFNVRLGDPEAEVLAVLDDRDWLAMMAAKAGVAGVSGDFAPPPSQGAAVCVVMASAGYPFGDGVEKQESLPLDALCGASDANAPVLTFAASVRPDGSGRVLTGSGRVLTVAARGANFTAARHAAYGRVDELKDLFSSARVRRDIGAALDEAVLPAGGKVT